LRTLWIFATLAGMKHLFTEGALRAISQAAGWSSRGDFDDLESPALLMGLLAESDCQAAITLHRHGIDAPAVASRWPALRRVAGRGPRGGEQPPRAAAASDQGMPIPPFSDDVQASLAALGERLQRYPESPALTTEHLLLGLAAAGHEVAAWLRGQGVDPDRLEARIRQPGTEPRGAPPPDEVHVLRVVDAALNRGHEGLRVVEDYVRFVLDDRRLTAQMKGLRHDLAAIGARIPMGRRLAARETRADVGTAVTHPSERSREGTRGVLVANFTRLEESLRTLEEFGKILDPDLAAEVKQLRYRTYTLQRAVEITRDSRERLDRARLYVLVDARPSPEEFTELVRSLVEARVGVLQLRDKRLDDRRLLERARLLGELTRGSETLFIVNDRPDLALLARADGVHVGQEELTAKDARSIVGPDALIGVSTHSVEQARRAVLDGANYVGVGPVFPSDTKHFEAVAGLELLRAVSAEIRLPAFAIGGINSENLPEVLAAGFDRVAVGGAILSAADPADAAKELLAVLVPANDSPVPDDS